MSASETPKPDSDQPSQPPSPVGDGSMGASGAAANRGVASGMPPDGLASDPGSGPATASASAKGTESASASAHTPNPGTAPAPDSTAATKPETSPAPDPEPAPDVPGPRAAKNYDAIIVGSGPNGLAAAVRLALEGLTVLVLEAEATIGGGTRTKELIQPGYLHDVCSAVHPLGISSPFFRRLPLHQHGLQWLHPDLPVAHALDRGEVAFLHRDLQVTVEAMGDDGQAYYNLVHQLVDNWGQFTIDGLAPLGIPQDPALLTSFGLNAIQSARSIARRFKNDDTRALFAGIAAHGIQNLDRPLTAAIGIVLSAAAHASGWPVAKGGSQAITNALASYLRSLGGDIRTGFRLEKLSQLPPTQAVLFDLTPRQVEQIMGERLPMYYRKRLLKFRYGWGSYKMDFLLNGPVPWRNEVLQKAGTVHLGGTFEEIAAAEKVVSMGRIPQKPYVLVAQPGAADPSRSPDEKQVLWAYCHVPHGSTVNMRRAIVNQIERFAPGFRNRIIEDRGMNTKALEKYNANYIGGDINGGVQDWRQFFSRPVSAFSPYTIPVDGYYFCSSSTPPGGGVHGMCGFHAAESALRRTFRTPSANWKFSLKME